MRTRLLFAFFCTLLTAPCVAQTTTAAAPQAASIADGTYTATVVTIIDAKHITVKLSNGSQTTLSTARPNVDFTKAHPNDHIKLSVISGLVAVYAVSP